MKKIFHTSAALVAGLLTAALVSTSIAPASAGNVSASTGEACLEHVSPGPLAACLWPGLVRLFSMIVAAPAAPAPVVRALNWDESGGDPLPPGQSQLAAKLFRFERPATESETIAAIVALQKMAILAGADVREGHTLELDNLTAWEVWCYSRPAKTPSDVGIVFEVQSSVTGRLWHQTKFATDVPTRTVKVWDGCTEKFWAVRTY